MTNVPPEGTAHDNYQRRLVVDSRVAEQSGGLMTDVMRTTPHDGSK